MYVETTVANSALFLDIIIIMCNAGRMQKLLIRGNQAAVRAYSARIEYAWASHSLAEEMYVGPIVAEEMYVGRGEMYGSPIVAGTPVQKCT